MSSIKTKICAERFGFRIPFRERTALGHRQTPTQWQQQLFPSDKTAGACCPLKPFKGPKLRISGPVPLLPLYAFKSWKGTTFSFLSHLSFRPTPSLYHPFWLSQIINGRIYRVISGKFPYIRTTHNLSFIRMWGRGLGSGGGGTNCNTTAVASHTTNLTCSFLLISQIFS